jgi:hypothetical protein
MLELMNTLSLLRIDKEEFCLKLKYVKWHNNYDELILNNTYEGSIYNQKWVLINETLYRKECFKC